MPAAVVTVVIGAGILAFLLSQLMVVAYRTEGAILTIMSALRVNALEIEEIKNRMNRVEQHIRANDAVQEAHARQLERLKGGE